MLATTTTITILPTHLRLVHIPLSQKEALMHSILDCWLFRRKDDPFFALCSNGVELSLFADAAAVRRCFGKYMAEGGGTGSRSGSGSSSPGRGGFANLAAQTQKTDVLGKGKGKAVKEGEEKVVVGEDLWVALEIAFGGNGWEEAGARVHSLSAPLAARQLSILFLSTFHSDYILVRASSLALVTSILEEEGFSFSEPLDEREEREVDAFLEEGEELEFGSSAGGDGTGSGRTTRRGSRDDGLASMTSSLVLSDEGYPGGGGGHGARSSSTPATTRTPSRSNSRSHSRSHSRNPSPSVSRSNSLNLRFSGSSSSCPPPPIRSNSMSSTLSPPLYPSTAINDSPALSPSITAPPGRSLSLLPDELVCVGLSTASPAHEALWRQKVIEALFFPERVVPISPSSSSPTTPRPGHRPLETRPTAAQPPPTPFLALTQTPDSASLTADVRLLRAGFLGSAGGGGGAGEEALFTVGVGGLEGRWAGEEGVRVRRTTRDGGAGEESTTEEEWEGDESALESASESEAEEEGYSTTPSDGGEWVGSLKSGTTAGAEDEGEDDEEEEGNGERTLLKCLQLDLIRFGLDKPGLVEHYASLLISSGITSLLYQSTFGSANILVAKRDVRKAREVLARG
ncbi:hypothetical protein JCM8097_008217 [Rhodosporidiobolus ruineniae]